MRAIGRRSSVEEVIAQLNEALAKGTWALGDRLPTEHELTERLGVSRTVVREAVRALVHLGVLETRQGAGTYVISTADPAPLLRRVGMAEVREIFEIQLGLDVQAARLAAARRTDADVERLRTLLGDRNRAAGPQEFARADAAYHLAVVEAAGNSVLLEFYRFFVGRLRDSLHTLRSQDTVPESGDGPHEALLAAIEAGDEAAAAAAAAAAIRPSLDTLGPPEK
ncbi:FadR/GntR family transcriptional regulator [Streptomyces caatingaensis]|uniref:GntR family transcriptional regulator n=1 Tax=Streptomyces caatingaensis TaxID=1678637 RepID=A0A0K9XK62_9ACTN|nr:FCD domain-containing protein [Streptomyces caatingaensis]KNB53740.1 GntR family transcriptional regulator [Streptomyces caatingaensis]